MTATSLVRSRQEVVQTVQSQQAVVGQGDVAQHGAGAGGQLLPGDEVRVVLHLGQEDFVAGAEVRVAPAPRHEVDARGRAGGENHLLDRRRR